MIVNSNAALVDSRYSTFGINQSRTDSLSPSQITNIAYVMCLLQLSKSLGPHSVACSQKRLGQMITKTNPQLTELNRLASFLPDLFQVSSDTASTIHDLLTLISYIKTSYRNIFCFSWCIYIFNQSDQSLL